MDAKRLKTPLYTIGPNPTKVFGCDDSWVATFCHSRAAKLYVEAINAAYPAPELPDVDETLRQMEEVYSNNTQLIDDAITLLRHFQAEGESNDD